MFGKPRLVQLGEVAAHAEALQRKRQIRGYAMRVAFGTTAFIVGLMLLLAIHAAVYSALADSLGELGAVFAVIGIDLAVTLILGWLAKRKVNDPLVTNAKSIRDAALWGTQNEIRTLGGLWGSSKIGNRSFESKRPNLFGDE